MNSDNPPYDPLLEYWQEQRRRQQTTDRRWCEILRFQGENSDLPITFNGGIIWFENNDGHIRLHLELTEDASLEDIKQNWHVIKEWQQRLLKWQGPWTRGGKGGLLAHLDLLKKRYSYSKIADMLNDSIAKELTTYLAYEREFEKLRPSFKTWQDFILWRWWEIEGVNPAGFERAVGLLLDTGMGERDALIWCREILANLRAGEPPFLPDGGPVTKDRVRDIIRYWRRH